MSPPTPPSTPTPGPELPSTIDRYRLTHELGRGGMGVVYAAEDPQLGRTVAVKVILFPHQASEEQRSQLESRFEREARAAAGIHHPGVITVFDFGRDGDYLYLVMELVEGTSLADRLTTGPALASTESFELIARVAEALAAAHGAGVVHRDVTPRNILLADDGRVIVTDFGVARSLGEETQELTRSGALVGSPRYMAPEMVRNLPFDGRADLFSLGVVLHRLLTGRPAFHATDVTALLYQVVHEDPLARPETRDGLRPGPRQFLERCLAKAPDDRFTSAQDLAREARRLARALTDADLEKTVALPNSSADDESATAAQGFAGLRPALALLLVVLMSGVGWWWTRETGPIDGAASGAPPTPTVSTPAPATAPGPGLEEIPPQDRASRDSEPRDSEAPDSEQSPTPLSSPAVVTSESSPATGPRGPEPPPPSTGRGTGATTADGTGNVTHPGRAGAEESRQPPSVVAPSSPEPTPGVALTDGTSRHETSTLDTATTESATTDTVTTDTVTTETGVGGNPTAATDGVAPVLAIDPLSNDFEAQELVLSGRVMDDRGAVTLTVEGEPVAIDSSGAFSVVVPLAPGVNRWTLVAIDGAGNQTLRVVELALPVATAERATDPPQVPPTGARLQHPRRFADWGDGTLVDTVSGLIWTKRLHGEDLSWRQARGHCRSLDLAGRKDWALPKVDELEELYRIGTLEARRFASGSLAFPPVLVWSSTRDGFSAALAFDFAEGRRQRIAFESGEGTPARVFCVRRPPRQLPTDRQTFPNDPSSGEALPSGRPPGGGGGGGGPGPGGGGGGQGGGGGGGGPGGGGGGGGPGGGGGGGGGGPGVGPSR